MNWHERTRPAQKGCDAAYAFMSLVLSPVEAAPLREPDRWGQPETRRANDILRACDLGPLPPSDPGVRKNMRKAVDGELFEPVLIVSCSCGAHLADGYHRVSFVCDLDPFEDVPCFIADL